jgi:hypothetical protein
MSRGEELERKYASLFPHLNERQQHLIVALDAEQFGRGGITLVSRVSGFSRPTVSRAIRDLHQTPLPIDRVRHSGAGRKRSVEHDPQLIPALEALIDPETRGDPMSPLRWTCKSTRQLARLLTEEGHPVSHTQVAALLHSLHYSLQGNAKAKEGKQHPDRDARFRYIRSQGESFLGRGWPVISVDTKKKELVGNYGNSGREWQPEGQPVEVDGHDLPDPHVPKAVPRGVYDRRHNEAVSSGSWSDRRWWFLRLTCLLENPVGRCMVARHTRLHLLMTTTAGTGRFPPAITPCDSQSLPQRLAQLSCRRHRPQQREQWPHVDQLADGHQLPLHVIEQLLVRDHLRLTLLVRRQVDAHDLQGVVQQQAERQLEQDGFRHRADQVPQREHVGDLVKNETSR